MIIRSGTFLLFVFRFSLYERKTKQSRTYAVGALRLQQSGTFFFNGVRVFRATRGKPAQKRSASTMLPQAKTWRCDAG
jgi:hypothetical protein